MQKLGRAEGAVVGMRGLERAVVGMRTTTAPVAMRSSFVVPGQSPGTSLRAAKFSALYVPLDSACRPAEPAVNQHTVFIDCDHV